jgi:hypothetical protein
VDADGQADRCVAPADAGDKGKPNEAKRPTCRGGLELKTRSGEDVCERIERPRCPSGFTLLPRKGPDRCAP